MQNTKIWNNTVYFIPKKAQFEVKIQYTQFKMPQYTVYLKPLTDPL